jgi:uncharacterized damage-inducible protein DinB
MSTIMRHYADLLRYDTWANERSLVSIESIPAERARGEAYERLTTLVPHNIVVRRVWRWRVLGTAFEKPVFFPPMTPAQTRELQILADQEWAAFLPTIGEADLSRVVSFTTSDGSPYQRTLGTILTHVFTHATYHRGQIARLVTEHGGTRAVTDYFAFGE